MAGAGGLTGWLGDEWDGVGTQWSWGAKAHGEHGAWPPKEHGRRQQAPLSCSTAELPG